MLTGYENKLAKIRQKHFKWTDEHIDDSLWVQEAGQEDNTRDEDRDWETCGGRCVVARWTVDTTDNKVQVIAVVAVVWGSKHQ